MTHSYDVAVIGAGIAGSVIAKSLADDGWRTVLFDRKLFPRHKVCGEFLSPESRRMFGKLGLLAQVEALQPCSIRRTRLIHRVGKPLEIALPGIALGVSRFQLDEALHQAALSSGVNVLTETTVMSVNPMDEGYIIETKQGANRHVYHARAVIAACGANGLPGLQSASNHEPKPMELTHLGVKSHYKGIDLDDVVELYFFEGGYLGISPIENGLVNVAALLTRKTFHSTDKSILGFIEAACHRNPRLWQRMASAKPVMGTQAAVAPVNLTRKPLAWDRFPLLGDAATMIPPLCGDGMSMALRSAQLCAPLASRYLKDEITLADWEKVYTRAVHKEFHGPLMWGRFLQRVLSLPLLPRMMLAAGQFTPELAVRFVQATRLKETDCL